jgi:hypothetical protein
MQEKKHRVVKSKRVIEGLLKTNGMVALLRGGQ